MDDATVLDRRPGWMRLAAAPRGRARFGLVALVLVAGLLLARFAFREVRETVRRNQPDAVTRHAERLAPLMPLLPARGRVAYRVESAAGEGGATAARYRTQYLLAPRIVTDRLPEDFVLVDAPVLPPPRVTRRANLVLVGQNDGLYLYEQREPDETTPLFDRTDLPEGDPIRHYDRR